MVGNDWRYKKLCKMIEVMKITFFNPRKIRIFFFNLFFFWRFSHFLLYEFSSRALNE
jgi:hypothetical protein